MLGIEFCPFISLRGQFFNFANLPQQALAFALVVLFHGACLHQRFVCLAPGGKCLLHLGAAGACIGIQQFAHRVGLHQALPGMLAMDFYQ